jgi:hypothetical protein
MDRRQFLGLMAALAAGGAAATPGYLARAAADRLSWWDPTPDFLARPSFPLTVVEWRYLAGRIVEGEEDYGFVVSIADYKFPLNAAPFNNPPQILVMRHDFATGAQRSRIYDAAFTYDAATATYIFTATADPAITVTWRLDVAAQTYALSVASPELTLAGLTLAPAGDLVAEAGTGRITTARIEGVDVLSDYHADWVAIRRGETTIGYGRLDMQTLDPASVPTTLSAGFSHHWFGLAADTAAGPVWVSAWHLVSQVTTWVATVARGTGAGWSVASFSELTPGFAFPVAVTTLDWQRQPVDAGAPARRTGKAWRVTAGQSAPGDLLDLTFSVPPGQFVARARVVSGLAGAYDMQEALTSTASGTVGGQPISGLRFAVAESTTSEDARAFLPHLTR